MEIFHEEFKTHLRELYSKKKKLIHCLALIFFFLLIKYGLFNINYDSFHVVVSLATFGIYFTVIFYFVSEFIKKKKTLLANVAIFLLLFLVSELVFYFVGGMPKKTWKDYNGPVFPADDIRTHLGNIPWADSVWHDVRVKKGDTLFDVTYDVDNLHRRVTPGYDNTKEKYAVFFGCSIAFGYGLEDNQTIPYYFQKHTETYNSYNYGYSGWGGNNVLARLEQKDLTKEIKEKEGIGVYIFIWPHIRRAIGDLRIYTEWGHTMPYYYMDGNELKRDGNFSTGRKGTSKFYEILDKSHTLNFFEFNLPFKTTEEHMILSAEIAKKAKETYIRQFGNDNFYVVIHPVDWLEFTPEVNEKFKKILKERGVDCLDYSQKIIQDNNHIIVGDGHPNEKSDEKFAKMLIKDLGLK